MVMESVMSLPIHRGDPFDHHALNAPAICAFRSNAAPFSLIIVPGYTPRFGWRDGLHPKNIERLERARLDLELGAAPTILVSGAAVHSADNEALLMREWLLARHVRQDQILIEPFARHTTTNLRNAGRMMHALGAKEALVISSDGDWLPSRARHWRFAEQSYYLGFPWLSTFHLRCLIGLRHAVGQLDWLGPMHVRFRPRHFS